MIHDTMRHASAFSIIIMSLLISRFVSPLWMGRTTSPPPASSEVTESRMRVPLTGEVCSSSTSAAVRHLACSLACFEAGDFLEVKDIFGFLMIETSLLLLLLLLSELGVHQQFNVDS